MPRHKENRVLPYSSEQLFDLVAAVDRYPEFLPWCRGARILERHEGEIKADLIIGYKMFQERFTSVVTLDRPHSISVKYMSGPLSHLSNDWKFRAVKGGCEIAFQVDFDFRSPLLRAAMEMFFDKALSKMVAAFEARARELYGRESSVNHKLRKIDFPATEAYEKRSLQYKNRKELWDIKRILSGAG